MIKIQQPSKIWKWLSCSFNSGNKNWKVESTSMQFYTGIMFIYHIYMELRYLQAFDNVLQAKFQLPQAHLIFIIPNHSNENIRSKREFQAYQRRSRRDMPILWFHQSFGVLFICLCHFMSLVGGEHIFVRVAWSLVVYVGYFRYFLQLESIFWEKLFALGYFSLLIFCVKT